MNWRRLAMVGAVLLLLAIGLVVLLVLAAPPLSDSAGACEDVTSSGCWPFLEALHRHIDGNGREVQSIVGLPWCGEDACQPIFGASVTRLRVTYGNGGAEEYVCSEAPLSTDATCDLAPAR
jgi:hypothetical protein